MMSDDGVGRAKKFLKWAGIAVASLSGLIVTSAIVLFAVGGSRLDRIYDIPVAALDVRRDEATIARGRHLAEAVLLCHACHGESLAGNVLIDEPRMATLYAPNLTSGRGGIGASYDDADYVRAIRHGVNRDGRGLLIMHSDAYNNLGEQDLVAVVSYLESVPPVDNVVPRRRIAPLGKIFTALGLFDTEVMPLIPAATIDHARPFPDVPPQGVTSDYGRYLVSIALCSMCHGKDLTGGPPIEAGAPPGPNLIVYGSDDGSSQAQFITTIRTGVTPYGKVLDAEAMPWEVYAKMTDDELAAIRLYVASLSGSR